MSPNHENGRCKFHGGFPLTGAPKGNRNAVLHGLYSRRVALCGNHCPQWNSCPLAIDDVLKTPYKERPHCPYEETEYAAVMSDQTRRINNRYRPDPSLQHLAHQVALLQVMTSRAAAALRSRPLIETNTATGENYHTEYTKVSATLQAFTKIAAEFRRMRHLLDDNIKDHEMVRADWVTTERHVDELREQQVRLDNDTDPHPDAQATLPHTPNDADVEVGGLLGWAVTASTRGDEDEALRQLRLAQPLDPERTALHVDKVSDRFSWEAKKDRKRFNKFKKALDVFRRADALLGSRLRGNDGGEDVYNEREGEAPSEPGTQWEGEAPSEPRVRGLPARTEPRPPKPHAIDELPSPNPPDAAGRSA